MNLFATQWMGDFRRPNRTHVTHTHRHTFIDFPARFHSRSHKQQTHSNHEYNWCALTLAAMATIGRIHYARNSKYTTNVIVASAANTIDKLCNVYRRRRRRQCRSLRQPAFNSFAGTIICVRFIRNVYSSVFRRRQWLACDILAHQPYGNGRDDDVDEARCARHRSASIKYIEFVYCFNSIIAMNKFVGGQFRFASIDSMLAWN